MTFPRADKDLLMLCASFNLQAGDHHRVSENANKHSSARHAEREEQLTADT